MTFTASRGIIYTRETANRWQPVAVISSVVIEKCRFLAELPGGGYLFSSIPSRIAAIISISNAMVSVALIGFTSLLSPEDGPASLAHLT